MSKEILIKAIEKAIENGWERMKTEYRGDVRWQVVGGFGGLEPTLFTWVPGFGEGEDQQRYYHSAYQQRAREVIFDHSFAKALWGEAAAGMPLVAYEWQYHLQQMVIAGNPINYLGENIPVDN